MKILVVDDDFISRKTMEKVVEKLGDCISVDSGGAALDAFNDAWNDGLPYDLIFLDISMPGMSGIDVLKNIRHIEKNKKLTNDMQAQILMMTAHSDKENVMACIEFVPRLCCMGSHWWAWSGFPWPPFSASGC